MASLFSQNDLFDNGLWMLGQATAKYKCIWLFIESVWIHIYNFLFLNGKDTQRQTPFYFYAAHLDFDLKTKWVSIKAPFPKSAQYIYALRNDVCMHPISDFLVMIYRRLDGDSLLITATNSLSKPVNTRHLVNYVLLSSLVYLFRSIQVKTL